MRPDRGGELIITWSFTYVDAQGKEVTDEHDYIYTVGSTPSGLPYRLFWTEDGYDGPLINLTGKQVKFYFNDSVKQAEPIYKDGDKTIVEGYTPGVLFKDGMLHAFPGQEGYFLLQYHKTQDLNDHVSTEGCIVVEVANPRVYTLETDIGTAIRPFGDGYDISQCIPSIVAGEKEGACYTHTTGYQTNGIYPIKNTFTMPWEIDVYWQTKDIMGTIWPFEKDWYGAKWPDKTPIFIRGDEKDWGAPIKFPADYAVSLCAYQEPTNHAILDDNNLLHSFTPDGYCTVKLEANNEVWFQPLHALARNSGLFDTETNKPWPIATEIKPYATSVGCRIGSPLLTPVTFPLNHVNPDPTMGDPALPALSLWLYTEKSTAEGEHQTLFTVNLTDDNSHPVKLYATIDSTGTIGFDYLDKDVLTQTVSPWKRGTKQWFNVIIQTDGSYAVDGEWRTLTLPKDKVNALAKGFYALSFEDNQTAIRFDDIRYWKDTPSRAPTQSIRNKDHLNLYAYYPVEADQDTSIDDLIEENVTVSLTETMFIIEPAAIGMQNRSDATASHGYIYAPTGTAYNTDFYQSPEQMVFAEQQALTETQPPEGWRLPVDASYIFGINTIDQSTRIPPPNSKFGGASQSKSQQCPSLFGCQAISNATPTSYQRPPRKLCSSVTKAQKPVDSVL